MGHLLHDERGEAGGDVAGKREQRPHADARRLPVRAWLGVRRVGQIGGRPENGPSSPVRQLDHDTARTTRRTDGNQRQSLPAERVPPLRHRHMGHQPIHNRGSVRCSVMPWPRPPCWIGSCLTPWSSRSRAPATGRLRAHADLMPVHARTHAAITPPPPPRRRGRPPKMQPPASEPGHRRTRYLARFTSARLGRCRSAFTAGASRVARPMICTISVRLER